MKRKEWQLSGEVAKLCAEGYSLKEVLKAIKDIEKQAKG